MESLVNLGEAHSLVEPSEAREETHTTVESLVNLGEARILVELSEAREEAHGVTNLEPLDNLREACSLVEPSEAREETRAGVELVEGHQMVMVGGGGKEQGGDIYTQS